MQTYFSLQRPERPLIPGCHLEREPEEGQSWQSSEKEKKLEAEIALKHKLAHENSELLQSSEIHKMLEYSTGFTYERFNKLCTIFDIPNYLHITKMNVPLNYKHHDWQLLRCPSVASCLQTASNIFNSWIHYMFDVLGELPIWPHRDVIAQNMPEAYREDYPTTFAI